MPATEIRNSIPSRLARVVPTDVPALMLLGRPEHSEVFVIAPEDIRGLSASEIVHRLGIKRAPAFYVIEFPTLDIQGELASPVFRADQCFIGGGRTRGGAREFIIPNQSIPPGATIREVH